MVELSVNNAIKYIEEYNKILVLSVPAIWKRTRNDYVDIFSEFYV